MEHAAPTDDFARKYRQLCRQAEHLAEVKRWHEARKAAHEAIRLNPTNHYAYCLYAYVLSKSDTSAGGLREALDYAEKGIRYSPEDEWGYRLRSVCLRQLGDIPAAIDAAKEAIRYDPYEPKTHYVLGWALIEAKAFDEAERVGRHLAELAPEWSSTFYLLGSVALNRQRNAEAETHFRRALEIEPDAAYLLNDLAVSVERQGRKAEAVELYSLALKLSPDSRLYRENVRQGVAGQIEKNPAILIPAGVLGIGIALILMAIRMDALSLNVRLGLAVAGVVVTAAGGFFLGEKQKRLKAGLNPVAAAVYEEDRKVQKRRNQAAVLRGLAQLGVIFGGIILGAGWIALTGKLLGAWALIGIILIFVAGVYLWGRIPASE
jgi:Flp pilus assembly protein TadD